MGREAQCICRWGDREGSVTALLESSELIVRGDIRARVALRALESVRAHAEMLEFAVGGERIQLELGATVARSWASAMVKRPPSLARKLGIAPTTRLHVTGQIDDDALRAALADAAGSTTSLSDADLAVVRTDDAGALLKWLDSALGGTAFPPVWVVYSKGRTAPLGESAVREVLRRFGFVDTKVCAVSERLTALRFTKVSA